MKSEGNSSSDYFLSITLEGGELRIRGNGAGLEHLSHCCLRLIGKTHLPACGHIHLMSQMNLLSEGSIPTIIEFTEKMEGQIRPDLGTH